jgi:hypothetical protein
MFQSINKEKMMKEVGGVESRVYLAGENQKVGDTCITY